MKKTISLLVLSVLLLVSCSSAPDGQPSGSDPMNLAPSLDAQNGEALKLLTKVSGIESSTSSLLGFYEVYAFPNGKANIIYTDYETRTRVILCSRPDCTHDNVSCTSYLGDNILGANLFMNSSKTKLYIVTNGNPDKETPLKLWQMDANGDNRKLLYSFGANEILSDAVVGNDSYLYFMTQSITSDMQTVKNLTVLDTDTSIAQKLKQFNGVCWLSGTDGNSLYILSSDGAVGATKYTNTFTLYAPHTGQETTIMQYEFDMDSDSNPIASMMVYENSLYLIKYSGNQKGSLVKFDTQSKKETVICENIPVLDTTRTQAYSPVDGYLFVESMKLLEPGKVTTVCNAINLSTGMLLPVKLSYGDEFLEIFVKTIGVYEEYYFVQSGVHMVQTSLIGNEGIPYEAQIETPVYSMILKTDFWSNKPNYIPIQDTVTS